MKISRLNCVIYSLKNCHKPFEQGFWPSPPLLGNAQKKGSFFLWGFPKVNSSAQANMLTVHDVNAEFLRVDFLSRPEMASQHDVSSYFTNTPPAIVNCHPFEAPLH